MRRAAPSILKVELMSRTDWSISFPQHGCIRYRKVVTRSRARSTGKYPSLKMGRMMQWESVHEANAFRFLDCDPRVVSYFEQPCLVAYVINGELQKHVPDLLVCYLDRKELWEIKSDADSQRSEILARTACLEEGLPKLGYDYRLVRASEIASEPMQTSRKTLLRFGRDTVSELDIEIARRALANSQYLVWRDACAGLYGPRGRNLLARLVLRGDLDFDWNQPLTSETTFSAREGAL